MAYRKLGRDNKHRRAMLANLTKDLIKNERIETTEPRAKEVRKMFDKMVTYGKKGSLVARRSALAFLHNDNEAVTKIFNDLAKRYETRNGGYTRILKLTERKGDDALIVILEIVE
ncbi:MAG: 50S ribosomal protein L17 [Bacilli bacterium]